MIKNLGITTEEVLEALKKLKCDKLADLTYDKVDEFRNILSK